MNLKVQFKDSVDVGESAKMLQEDYSEDIQERFKDNPVPHAEEAQWR